MIHIPLSITTYFGYYYKWTGVILDVCRKRNGFLGVSRIEN